MYCLDRTTAENVRTSKNWRRECDWDPKASEFVATILLGRVRLESNDRTENTGENRSGGLRRTCRLSECDPAPTFDRVFSGGRAPMRRSSIAFYRRRTFGGRPESGEGAAPRTYCFGPGLRSSSMFSIILTSPERWWRRLVCGRTASRAGREHSVGNDWRRECD